MDEIEAPDGWCAGSAPSGEFVASLAKHESLGDRQLPSETAEEGTRAG